MSSINELSALFPGAPYPDTVCEGGLDRVFRLASWEWVGQDGHGLEWDEGRARKLLVGLLRREGGVMFVGGELSPPSFFMPGFSRWADSHSHDIVDSISTMHLTALQDILLGVQHALSTSYATSLPLIVRVNVASHPERDSLYTRIDLMLNPAHPAVDDLLDEAGVGRDRLGNPIAIGMRNDFLWVNREAINEAAREAGGDEVRSIIWPSFFCAAPLGDTDWVSLLSAAVQVPLGSQVPVRL